MQGTLEEKEALEKFMAAMQLYVAVTLRGITVLNCMYGEKGVERLFPGYYNVVQLASKCESNFKAVLNQ